MANILWARANQELTSDKFGSTVFGLVYEANEEKLSLVLYANQPDNKLVTVGRIFKKALGKDIDEVIYELDDEALLVV